MENATVFITTTGNVSSTPNLVNSYGGEGYTNFYLNTTPLINYKPIRIVVDGKITACFFEDGEKIVIRCGENDFFSEEVGIAMGIMRKLYGNRNKFKKAIAIAEHPVRPEKKKKKI